MGNFGEAAAAAHLQHRGYTLLARQWACAAGELDLVARQGEELVFVEVRTRRGAAYGSPEESITAAKQARLITLAYAYLEAHSLAATCAWRIDVIAIELDRAGRIRRLNHIINAVEG
jgi:putative endonuclease